MALEDLTDVKIDVAVLNERYANIQAALDKTNATVAGISVKFDEVLSTMHAEAERRKFSGRIWAVVSHGVTLVGAVVIAKLLKEPFSIGL